MVNTKVFARWNAVLGIAHIFLAVFVLAETLKYPWRTPINIQYSKWTQADGNEDEACSAETPCFINEESNQINDGFNIGLLIPFFSFISGNHHLYVAIFTEDYVDKIKDSKGANPYRAFDYLFSSSLMIVVASVLFKAPPDLGFLFLAASVQAATILVGFCLELLPRGKGFFWPIFAAICIVYVFLWTSLLMPFSLAVEDAPAVVTLFILYLLESFLRFPIQFVLPELKKLYRRVLKGEYREIREEFTSKEVVSEQTILNNEFGWMALSSESKIPLLVLFYFGVVARHDSVLFGEPTDTVDSSASGPDDDKLVLIFFGTVIASILLEIVLRFAPALHGVWPKITCLVILVLWGLVFGFGLSA